MAGAQALATALELGVIDALAAAPHTPDTLAARAGVEVAGLHLLLGLLAGNGVPDFLLGLTDLVKDERRFMAQSRMFQVFDYARAAAPGPENTERTRRWVRFTTALTRHEAQACLDRHDFSRYAQWLDVGGNSGEFA